MPRKNIWILNHYAITPDSPGGTRHFDFSKELVKKDYDVVIFASGYNHAALKYTKVSSKKLIEVENFEGVQFVWLNTFPYKTNDWRRIANMFSYAVRVIGVSTKFKKPDVIIGSSVHPLAVVAAWLLSIKFKTSFIFEVRDLWPQTFVDMGVMKPKSLVARLLYFWEKFMSAKAEKIITLLPKAKNYFGIRGISTEKLHWIPNGVDLERFRNSNFSQIEPQIMEVFKSVKNKFKVVYVGAHGPANGLDTVIEAAAILRKLNNDSIQLILIGDGPEKAFLIKKANENKCENVSFLEPVNKNSVPAVLQQADLLLHSLKSMDVLKYGGSPNKLNDYLAAGKPIIMAAEISDDLVTEANAGIVVKPGVAEELVEGILKFFDMKREDREKLGLNGRMFAEKYLDIKILGEKLADLL